MALFSRTHCQSETSGKVNAEDGIAAIYPKPKTSGMGKPSKTYPYLLKGLSIIRPNQVWATAITYIRLVYLVAVMDLVFPLRVVMGTVKLT